MAYKYFVVLYLFILAVMSISLKKKYITLEDGPKLFKLSSHFIFSYSIWIGLSYLIFIWHFLNVGFYWVFICPMLLFFMAIILDYVFGFKTIKSHPYILNFSALDLWYLPGVVFTGYLTK